MSYKSVSMDNLKSRKIDSKTFQYLSVEKSDEMIFFIDVVEYSVVG